MTDPASNEQRMRVPCDGPCIDCGREDVCFSVSPATWSKATGLPSDGGVLCVRCFEARAIKAGLHLRAWYTMSIEEELEIPAIRIYDKEVQELRLELAQAKELLEELMDIQNGPPLITDDADWHDIMGRCSAFLSRTEQKEE